MGQPEPSRQPPRTGVGPWVNGAVAIGLALAAATWLLRWPSPRGVGPAAVAQAALLWLWWLAAVLSAQWAVLRVARRRPPAWPFVHRPLDGPAAGALALLVGVVLLLREGVLGPAAALEFDWYDNARHDEVRARLQSEPGPQGLPLPPTLRGAYLECEVVCEPGGPVCASFDRWLVCDDEQRERPPGAERTEVRIEARRMGAPRCWMPLRKRGRLEPVVQVRIREGRGPEARTHRLRIDATVQQTLTGLASCRSLHERLGHAMAEIVAGQLQALVER